MIKIVAKQYIKEGKLPELSAGCTAVSLRRQTRTIPAASDTRCSRTSPIPLIVTVIEEWQDQASLDNHMKAKHFLEAIPVIGGLCEKTGRRRPLQKALLGLLCSWNPPARAGGFSCRQSGAGGGRSMLLSGNT